jgi:hypothetical protein
LRSTVTAPRRAARIGFNDPAAFRSKNGKPLRKTANALRAFLSPSAIPVVIAGTCLDRKGQLHSLEALRRKLPLVIEKATSDAPVSRHDVVANPMIIRAAGAHDVLQRLAG